MGTQILNLKLPKRFKHQIEFMRWPPPARGIALITGVGGGKTHAHCRKAVLNSMYMPGIDHTCVSPTYQQARRTIVPGIFDTLEVDFGLKEGVDFKYNRQQFFFDIKLWNGKIYICSGDKPASLKGQNIGSFGMDEPASQKVEVFKEMIARLRDPRASYLHYYLTGTPEGLNWLSDLCEPDIDLTNNNCLTCTHYIALKKICKQDDKFHTKYKTTVTQNDICENYLKKLIVIRGKTTDNESLPQSYINDLYDKYSKSEVEAYVNGKFLNLSDGSAFDFDRKLHIRKTKIDPSRQLLVGMDFNYKVMTATICQEFIENNILKIKVIDEIYIQNATGTTELCNKIIDKFRNHEPGFVLYPDPACQNRASHNNNTDTGNTDLILLHNAFAGNGYIRGHNYFVRMLDRSENIRIDCLRSVNAMFKNGLGYIRIAIDPKCKNFINDLQKITKSDYINNTIEKKNPFLGHLIDGFKYLIQKDYKIKISKPWEKNI